MVKILIKYNNYLATYWIMTIFLIGSFLVIPGCEKVIYVDVPIDNSNTDPKVTVSIYNSKVEYENGEPYVTIRGKVKNYGPGSISNIKVIAHTNLNDSKIAAVTPGNLQEEKIGDWGVTGLNGTYVSQKAVLFDTP